MEVVGQDADLYLGAEDTMVPRLLWGLSFAAAAFFSLRASAMVAQAWAHFVGVASIVCMAVIVEQTGGITSPNHAWLLAFPLIVPIIVPEDTKAVLAVSVALWLASWVLSAGYGVYVGALLSAQCL